MRRTVLFVVVAVIALVVLPGLGIGQPTTNHCGTPSDVYMSTSEVNSVCNSNEAQRRPVSLMPTAVTVGQQSHVLVYFTSTLSHYRLTPELLLTLQIEGTNFSETSDAWIEQGRPARGPHATVTVMWAFGDVAPGDYTVSATARMGGPLNGGPGAYLQACALTAFVSPIA